MITIKDITIYLQQGEEFKKDTKINAIRYRKLTSEELRIKKEIYQECQSINLNLYSLLIGVLSSEKYGERYYLEKIKNKLFTFKRDNNNGDSSYLDCILNSLHKIKKLIKKDDGYFKFLLNVQKSSENKEHFIDKILNYFKYEVKVEEEDIVEFLIGELEYYNLTKRIEKSPSENKTNLERTYILLDRHEKFKESRTSKDEIVKKLIIELENNNLDNKINNILLKFDISKLVKSLKKNIEKDEIDTELYGIYKEHYKKCLEDVNFEELSSEEKELYKIIYRYIKGRIEKILQNRNKIKNRELIVEGIFSEETLLEKIKIRVKQYLLEHILYLGKLKHHNISEVNTKRFVEEHANEELFLELITFFSATNIELNRLLKVKDEKDYDFFSTKPDRGKIKIRNTNSFLKFKLLKNLKFINLEATKIEDGAIEFLKQAYYLRNNLLHGKHEKIFKENEKKLSERYKIINEVIKELRVSDEEICKSLNLDTIFKGKERNIDDINIKPFGNNREKIYLPSFSKLVPEIKKLIELYDVNRTFNDESIKKIVLNGAIYVNKILYLKECSNSSSKFIKYLNEKINSEKKDISIEKMYKEAQISASKGNKNAISKYQKNIIEIYLEYLKENYKDIIDFSNLNLNTEEVKKDIKNRKNSENKILLCGIKQEVNPQNDFEYIISIFALLNDNIFINKIRNRFFSTDAWLDKDEYNYSNIIEILDEIISINVLRDELLNVTVDIEEIEDDILEENIENIIPKIEEKVFERIKKDFKMLLENNTISKRGLSEEDIKKISKIENEKIELTFAKGNIRFNLKNCGWKVSTKVFKGNINEYYEKEVTKKIEKIPILAFTKKSIAIISDEKFKNIYWQERKEGNESKKIFIYNKNILYLVTKHNFESLYKEFLKDKLKNLEPEKTELMRNYSIREKMILNVDNFLREINKKVKGYSEKYKKRIISNIKNENKYFKEIANNETGFKNYEEFEEMYNEVSKYKEIRDILNFNTLNKIYHYLIEINWKLAIQMARIERDLHYIVNGLNEIGLIKLSDRTKKNEDCSRAYPKYKDEEVVLESCYYNFDIKNYNKFEKICGKFGIDLSKKGELQGKEKDNIRNYISHFYILREPFIKETIANSVNCVSKLLSYRTRYNNSTYNSVFEVFKKDINLNYNFLKKKIDLNEKEYDELVQRKKISCLELKSYLDYKKVIRKLLFFKII